MKSVEMIRQYWEQLERLLEYGQYCASHEIKTIVCRDFWSWTAYAAVGFGLLLALVVGRKIFAARREYNRNSRRFSARDAAAADDVGGSTVNVEEATNVNLSQEELAAAIRQGLKVRAETIAQGASSRVESKPKVSPARELGTAMRDLTATIKQAVKERALVPPAPGFDRQSEINSEAGPQRELVTIMLTDMVGYSESMGHDEQRAYARLLEHNAIVRRAIADYRGREIKTIGDAFLVIFRSAFDAVDCALAIQRAFTDYNLHKELPDRILIRIGIHIGDILITNNDVFGDGVNIVSRIQPLAEPGGVCLSEAVFVLVRKKLEVKVERVDGASLKLKNISVAPDIYHLNMG